MQSHIRIETERAGRCFSIRQDWTDTREKHRTRGSNGTNVEGGQRRGKPPTPRANTEAARKKAANYIRLKFKENNSALSRGEADKEKAAHTMSLKWTYLLINVK